MKKVIALLLIALSLSSCEKDDICADGTTPNLIVEFFDIANPANRKSVPNLKVRGIGALTDLGNFNGVSIIELPLDITIDTVKFSLIINSTSTSAVMPPNEDFLQFNYTRQEFYVSRACGFNTFFELNSPDGVLLSNSLPTGISWIKAINIQTNSITTENETHIKILF